MRLWKLLIVTTGLIAVVPAQLGVAQGLSAEEPAIRQPPKSDKKKRSTAVERPQPASVTTRRVSQIGKAARADLAAPSASEGFIDLLQKNVQKGKEEGPKQYSPCAGLRLLLRQDWKDIGFLKCPTPVDEATGAEISFSDDRAAANRIWSVHGTVALVYNSVTGTTGSPLIPFDTTIGTYLTVNRLLNSSLAQSKTNKDTIAYGGMLELGYDTPTGQNYFRVRGGGVENRIKGTSAVNVTGEWLPVDPRLRIHYPFQPFGAPFIVRFDPALVAQYDRVVGAGQLLEFNGRTESFRIGPQLTLNLFPLPGETGFISRLSGSVSYHWAYEAFSRTALYWFQTSVRYNIDEAGHIAWVFGYQRGRDEEAGTPTDLFKISLTGKI